MKRALNELGWLIGIYLIATLIGELYNSNTASDINMHDTYAVSPGGVSVASKTIHIVPFFLIAAFLVYFARASYRGFKNIPVNLILMVTISTALFYWSTAITISLAETSPSAGLFYGYSKGFLTYEIIIKIILIIALGFTGFMTGRNFKTGTAK